MTTWLHTWLQRPVAVLAWAVALLLGGAWAATHVPLEWAPTVELPEVRITASWPGASPRAVERYVTAPIERAAGSVAGTAAVESLSQEGVATVILQINESTHLDYYVAQVYEQLALLEQVLPGRVEPYLTQKVPEALEDEQGFMTLQLVGELPETTLRRLAEERLAPSLRSVPGVASVDVEGGVNRELLITLNPLSLAAYHVTPRDVRQEVLQAFSGASYGRLRGSGQTRLLLHTPVDEIDALRRLALTSTAGGAPIRLGDVADLRLQAAPRRSISRIDGSPVITLLLNRAPNSHMLQTAGAVKERLRALRERLPEETRILVADDKSGAVQEQLRGLVWRGGIGLLLVILVLLFMLKSVRASSIVLFSVAVALAVALALMEPLGLTLNLLTLGGLVLVFGLLIDNSAVVAEQLILQRARLGARGPGGVTLNQEAASRALNAVWLPLLGGTLTTMAVMLPLIYLSGDLRALFLPFGVLTGLTLGVSLLTAALLVPVLGRFLPEPERAGRHILRKPLRKLINAPYRIATTFPKITLLGLLLLLGLPLWLLPQQIAPAGDERSLPEERLVALYNATIGSDVVQDVREVLDPALGGVLRPFVRNTTFGAGWDFQTRPVARVWLEFPPGTPIERADSLIQHFEQSALASPAVRRTIAQISDRTAFLRVLFEDDALQTAEPYLVRQELIQQAVQLAGLSVSVSGLLPRGYYSGSGMGISGMRVAAYGPNHETLEDLSRRFAAVLQQRSRRVVGVNIDAGRYGRSRSREVLRLRWTPRAQARSGATTAELAARLRPVFATRFPAFYTPLEDAPHLPVRIIVVGASSMDLAELIDKPLLVGDSTRVQLTSLADFSIEETPGSIERYNQQYKRYIAVDYRGPHRMGSEMLEQTLEAFPKPAGYRLETTRFSFFTEDVQRAFWWVLLATIGLVYLVTAIVFESWRLPWVVMLSVPTAVIGVALGYLWSGANFAEGAFIGAVLLVGIAANDSILLVDRFREMRRLRPHGNAGILARPRRPRAAPADVDDDAHFCRCHDPAHRLPERQ